jgi:hypothetical protein
MRLNLLVAGLVFAQSAQATVVLKLNRAQMTNMSSVVIHARVGKINVAEERPGALSTLIELEVLSSYKGKLQAGRVITLMQVGGQKGDLIQSIPGTSEFRIGEELVLFLSAFANRYVQVGVGLGRFVVSRNGGEVIVAEEFGDVSFASPGKDGVIRPGPSPLPARLKLSELAREIRGFVRLAP